MAIPRAPQMQAVMTQRPFALDIGGTAGREHIYRDVEVLVSKFSHDVSAEQGSATNDLFPTPVVKIPRWADRAQSRKPEAWADLVDSDCNTLPLNVDDQYEIAHGDQEEQVLFAAVLQEPASAAFASACFGKDKGEVRRAEVYADWCHTD